jgi:hypothetical protein
LAGAPLITSDPRESAFLFQCLSLAVQRFTQSVSLAHFQRPKPNPVMPRHCFYFLYYLSPLGINNVISLSISQANDNILDPVQISYALKLVLTANVHSSAPRLKLSQ